VSDAAAADDPCSPPLRCCIMNDGLARGRFS
jgi:hypothetical protein